MIAVGALVGGVAAYWLTAPPPEPAAPPRVAAHARGTAVRPAPGTVPPAGKTENRVPPGVNLEGGGSPASAARAPAQIADDPAQRKLLEREADLAASHWAKVAPKLSDPGLRAEAAAMTERLRVLNEPATIVAHEQYALTQKLLSTGEAYDRGTLAELQYLDSLAATVIQNGDPDEVITPEEAAHAAPRKPR